MRLIRFGIAGLTLLSATPVLDQPAFAQVAPDNPAALGEARAIVVKLLPPGTYKRLMSTTMSSLMDSMSDTIGALPLKQLAQLGGLDAKQAAALDKVDLARVMAIYDPHWQERTRLQSRAMFSAMGDFFDTIEPELRDAYAHAFVHTFTPDELSDLDRFFGTPTGAKFAGRYMTMAADPAILDVSKTMIPKMIAQMPRFVEAAQKAASALPPPRKLEELTPDEKAEMAKALGVTPDELKDPEPQP